MHFNRRVRAHVRGQALDAKLAMQRRHGSKKGDYKSESAASPTLPELERWLALEIAGVYHNSIHSSLSSLPLRCGKRAVSERKSMIRQPSDTEQFFIEFLPGETRTLQRDGIRLFNIRSWDNVLPMVGRIKEPML
jgi:putative transposase